MTQGPQLHYCNALYWQYWSQSRNIETVEENSITIGLLMQGKGVLRKYDGASLYV